VDDGSKDLQMSQNMLRLLADQGVTAVVATPHFYAASDNPEAFLDRRAEAFARSGETPIPVLAGAEVAYFDGMSRSDALQKLCLGSTRYLLVEMPYGTWSRRMIREICDLPVQQGVLPVLAHVDRYRKEFDKFAAALAEQDIPAQINADSLLSWRTRSWALRQLRQGSVRLLGSDCHNLTTRRPNIGQAADVIAKKLGPEMLQTLTAFASDLLKLS
jgi:protein-tyrosine phosphatase